MPALFDPDLKLYGCRVGCLDLLWMGFQVLRMDLLLITLMPVTLVKEYHMVRECLHESTVLHETYSVSAHLESICSFVTLNRCP